jgi:hypothetical protein
MAVSKDFVASVFKVTQSLDPEDGRTAILRNARSTHPTTKRHTPEKLSPQQHRCENPKSGHISVSVTGREFVDQLNNCQF